mmetsp:Transcript_36904/g.59986  ORF Transcript_36904/g.59986 Transcript_36904/m.59986 type:complete len:384 (+) Transcript_36904:3052-4203(+)
MKVVSAGVALSVAQAFAVKGDLLQDHYDNNGVLMHGAFKEYFQLAVKSMKSSTTPTLPIDADSGPLAQAWSFMKTGTPAGLFPIAPVGIFVGQNTTYTSTYAQSMTPMNAFSNVRQFCSLPEKDGFRTELSGMQLQYAPEGFNTSGCPETDDECKYVAAGGGGNIYAITGLNNLIVPSSSPELHFTLAEINAGEAKACGKPDRCNLTNYMDGRDFFTKEYMPFYNEFVKMFNDYPERQQSLYMNVSDLFPFQVAAALQSGKCSIPANDPKSWEFLAESYSSYMTDMFQPITNGTDTKVKVQMGWWNEVDIYVPLEAQQLAKAEKAQVNSLIGVFYNVNTKDDEAFELAQEFTRAFNKMSGREISLYNCTGRGEMKLPCVVNEL